MTGPELITTLERERTETEVHRGQVGELLLEFSVLCVFRPIVITDSTAS
jgi:hypothetical protein